MENKKERKNNISIGSSGEYYVAAELERRNYTVALPMANVKDFDILAINRSNSVQVAIQVKTNSRRSHSWTLSGKKLLKANESLFYVFVSFDYDNPDSKPVFHVVPSLIVKQYVDSSPKQASWKDDDRRFTDKENEFDGKWQLLDDYCSGIRMA